MIIRERGGGYAGLKERLRTDTVYTRCRTDRSGSRDSPRRTQVSPEGRIVSEAEWNANVGRWLPSAEDRAFVQSLMGRVAEPGVYANWIAAPSAGINQQPVNFEYVRFN